MLAGMETTRQVLKHATLPEKAHRPLVSQITLLPSPNLIDFFGTHERYFISYQGEKGGLDPRVEIPHAFHFSSGREDSKMSKAGAVVTLALFPALLLIVTRPAHAQTEAVLYNFTGGSDGGSPQARLTPDGAGNFYGTTNAGGSTP